MIFMAVAKSRRVVQRYVISPMSPEGVLRDVVAARYVAIR